MFATAQGYVPTVLQKDGVKLRFSTLFDSQTHQGRSLPIVQLLSEYAFNYFDSSTGSNAFCSDRNSDDVPTDNVYGVRNTGLEALGTPTSAISSSLSDVCAP